MLRIPWDYWPKQRHYCNIFSAATAVVNRRRYSLLSFHNPGSVSLTNCTLRIKAADIPSGMDVQSPKVENPDMQKKATKLWDCWYIRNGDCKTSLLSVYFCFGDAQQCSVLNPPYIIIGMSCKPWACFSLATCIPLCCLTVLVSFPQGLKQLGLD